MGHGTERCDTNQSINQPTRCVRSTVKVSRVDTDIRKPRSKPKGLMACTPGN